MVGFPEATVCGEDMDRVAWHQVAGEKADRKSPSTCFFERRTGGSWEQQVLNYLGKETFLVSTDQDGLGHPVYKHED